MFFLLFCVTSSYCLSFFHCISSIHCVFVCFLCRSLSFLRQLSSFFVFTSRSFSVLRHCLSLSFVLPLYFVNSLRLCLLSLSFFALLRQFFNFFLFVSRSFFFFCVIAFHCLSFFHCISSILCVFVCFLRRSLLFLRQLFNFLVFVSRSFSFLRNCLLYSFVHPRYFVNSLSLCLLSLSFFVFPTSVV